MIIYLAPIIFIVNYVFFMLVRYITLFENDFPFLLIVITLVILNNNFKAYPQKKNNFKPSKQIIIQNNPFVTSSGDCDA